MIYKEFPQIANLLNIKYFLYRPDIDFKLSGMRDPQTILKILTERYALLKEFGQLKIYDLLNKKDSSKLFIAKNIISTNKLGDMEDVFAVNYSPDDILVRSKDSDKFTTTSEIVHNTRFFEIDPVNYPKLIDSPDIFPHVNRLPDSKYYPLILLKEKILLMLITDLQQNTREKITLLGKRLIEIKKLKEKNNLELTNKYFKSYMTNLIDVLNLVDQMAEFKQPTDAIWRQDDMFNVFSSHLYELDRIASMDIVLQYKKILSDRGILPYWDFQDRSGNRVVYQFDIQKSGVYEFIVSKTLSFPDIFSVADIKSMQLDDKILFTSPIIMDNYLSLGSFAVNSGTHEISFRIPQAKNISEITEQILDTQGTSRIDIPLDRFDPFLRYEIGLNYLVDYGDGVNIDLELNTDLMDPKTKKMKRSLSKKFNRDSYSSLTQSFSFTTGGNNSADSARIDLWVDQWNNCRDLFQGKYAKKCNDKLIYNWFNRPSRVRLSNIRVYPKFPAQAKLVSNGVITDKIKEPTVVFEKIDSTKYKYNVKNAFSPFVMVFSELFDASWINSNSTEHFLVNGYANAWKINRTGDFDGIIEFYPQRLLKIGYIVSGVSVTFGLMLVIYLLIRHRKK
jgi:hypothetical protein